MGQLQWRLWLVGAAIFLLGNASGTSSPSHSLLHFRYAMLLEGWPQFVEVTYLDSQPIQRYDSSTKRMRPLTPWMNQTLTEVYWNRESYIGTFFLKEIFLKKFQKPTVPQKHHNQSTDHILQCIEGCKFTTNGEEIEIHQDAVDGKEIDGGEFHNKRFYLDGNCIRWLNRYLSNKPQRKGPSAKVTTHVLNVNDTRLNCSVCNFYPEDIEATWKKDGEFWDHEIYRGDTIRNWDGTYCTWISIEINPMEEDRYCCYVGHDGLKEPLCVKALKLEIPNEENLIFILYYTTPVLGILILGIIGILCYKKCPRRDYRAAAKSDPNSSMDNPERSPLKETEGIPPLNNTAGEESKGNCPPSQGIGEKKQPPENHQISV